MHGEKPMRISLAEYRTGQARSTMDTGVSAENSGAGTQATDHRRKTLRPPAAGTGKLWPWLG